MAFFWQGQEDSNPRPTVLETGTLPAELYPYVDFVNTSYYITLFVGLQAFFEKKFLSSKKSLFGRFFSVRLVCGFRFLGGITRLLPAGFLDQRRRACLQRKRGEPVGAVTEGSAAQSAVGARSRSFSVILSKNPFRRFSGLRAMNLWRCPQCIPFRRISRYPNSARRPSEPA